MPALGAAVPGLGGGLDGITLASPLHTDPFPSVLPGAGGSLAEVLTASVRSRTWRR